MRPTTAVADWGSTRRRVDEARDRRWGRGRCGGVEDGTKPGARPRRGPGNPGRIAQVLHRPSPPSALDFRGVLTTPRSSATTLPAPGQSSPPVPGARGARSGSASRSRMSRASAFGSSDSNGMPTRCSPLLVDQQHVRRVLEVPAGDMPGAAAVGTGRPGRGRGRRRRAAARSAAAAAGTRTMRSAGSGGLAARNASAPLGGRDRLRACRVDRGDARSAPDRPQFVARAEQVAAVPVEPRRSSQSRRAPACRRPGRR